MFHHRLERVTNCLLSCGEDNLANIGCLTALCGELLSASCALYNRLDGDLLCALGQWQAPPDFKATDSPDGHICYDVIKGSLGEVVLIRNLPLTHYAETDPNVSAYALHTYLGCIVVSEGKAVGSLCIVYQADYVPTEEDKKLLKIIAVAIGHEDAKWKSKEALGQSASLLKATLEATVDGILVVNRKWRIEDCNKRFTDMWRIPKEVLATRDAGRALNYVLNFVNDPVGFAARVREIYADPLAESFDILALKDGRTFERLSRPQMLGNEVIGRVWSFRDISDKKKAEDKLRESEERYRAVIETTETGFVVLDRDGLVLDANQEYIRITGYRRLADITGRSVTEWTADYDLERNAMEVTECFERGFVRNLNIDYVHSDGTIIPIEINATVVDTNKGPLIVTICRDNTARKRFEEALNESRERIQLILNSMAEGIYGLDLDGRCTFCNPSAAAMLGYDDETELVGRDMHQLVHHTKADGAPCSHDECIAVKAVRDKVPLHSDSEVLWRADGRSFPAEFWAYPIIKNDAVLGTVVTFVNISERVALERQLLQAQKMEAVGHLAGGIAHDFNNNLSAIIGYAYLLRAKIAGDDAMASDLDQILDSANRAAEVTRSLLAFSRQQVMNPTIVNINDLVLKLEKLITRLIGEDIEVTINLSPDPVTCMIDAVQIEQVLINIFTNARDAMPDGGRLEISTSLYNHEGGSTVLAERMKPGLYAVITVTDTGHGMDPATMSKIFEPFYTTKEFGRGTGLGLSMVYGIVKQNQGYIDVESSIGVGTAFRIYFHVVRSSAAEMTGSKEAGVSSGGTETILIAEDDPRLRKLYNIILTKSGYRTIEAENGEEAVTKFAEAHDAIDIVLMDMIMPKKSGKEAYAEIRIIKPDAKVIFLSGYTADRINDDTLKNEDVYFITKPVQPKDLTRLIRKALDS